MERKKRRYRKKKENGTVEKERIVEKSGRDRERYRYKERER
jgi:hypothetical protein